jgi:hypothetical protein
VLDCTACLSSQTEVQKYYRNNGKVQALLTLQQTTSTDKFSRTGSLVSYLQKLHSAPQAPAR